VDWNSNVNKYIETFTDGCPEELRPKVCPKCESEKLQQKHAHFTRNIHTLLELVTLTIYRFLCPTCEATYSLLPSFFRKNHTIANEVQELVIARMDSGEAMMQAGGNICASVTVSKKTVGRWRNFWEPLIEAQEEMFVQQVLILKPALALPVGDAKTVAAGTPFRWLSYIWHQVSTVLGNFSSD
jgi:hypothetical protein